MLWSRPFRRVWGTLPLVAGVALAQAVPSRARQGPVVTTVPFDLGAQGHILVQAEVAGHRGTFLLDTGWPGIGLNSEYLRRAVHGPGYDTVTAASRDSADADMRRNPYGDTADVPVRLGTLTIHVNRRNERPASLLSTVSDLFDVERGQELESGFQRPILGVLGPNVLAQFETVIDYAHHQLLLIPVDAKGRRLVTVPKYVPATVVPMRHGGDPDEEADQFFAWVVDGRVGTTQLSLLLDTGSSDTHLTSASKTLIAAHVQDGGGDSIRGRLWQLDSLVLGAHAYARVTFVSSPSGTDNLGAPFFMRCGAIGFNFRARQFLLYRDRGEPP